MNYEQQIFLINSCQIDHFNDRVTEILDRRAAKCFTCQDLKCQYIFLNFLLLDQSFNESYLQYPLKQISPSVKNSFMPVLQTNLNSCTYLNDC